MLLEDGVSTAGIRLIFDDAYLERLQAPQPYDVLLGAVGRVRLECGGVVVYREELFPIAELALALEDWLRDGLPASTDLVFDSVEHDEPGLIWCRSEEEGWRLGSIHADAADPFVHSSEEVAEAFHGFVEAVRSWVGSTTGRDLDTLRTTPLRSQRGRGMTSPERNRLILIGYWSGPDTSSAWPTAGDFVDEGWDADDRSLIADYLRGGHVAWAFMGWSRCRMCGQNNGDLELTDGTYLWPSGLVHYVEDHGVRLPQPFVAHAQARMEVIEQAERDGDWWKSAQPEARTPTSADTPALSTDIELEDRSLSGFVAGAVRLPRGLVGREHILRAVDELGQELADGTAEGWENSTLERFLDAFGALLPVIELSYRNAGRPVPLDPWVLVAEALRGAREYE